MLLAHYGLGGDAAAATYEQVGQRLGLSKQRVRQIEQSALAKLRAVLAAGERLGISSPVPPAACPPVSGGRRTRAGKPPVARN